MLNPLSPKECNGLLIDNKIFNGLNCRCAQLWSILTSVPCLKPLHTITHSSPLGPHHSPLITHPLALNSHHSSCHSPCHSPLITHQSSLTPHYSPLITLPSSLTPSWHVDSILASKIFPPPHCPVCLGHKLISRDRLAKRDQLRC